MDASPMSTLINDLKNGTPTQSDQRLLDDEKARLRRQKQAKREVAAETATAQPFVFYQGDEILTIPRPKLIVAGRFVQGSLVFVMGEPGVGKTFWMLSFNVAVASGQMTWLSAALHEDFRDKAVVYALAEGAGL